MATLRVSFEEIGGVTEFNGMPLFLGAAYIVNKAADYLGDTVWHGCDDANFVDYRETVVCFASRNVFFAIHLK